MRIPSKLKAGHRVITVVKENDPRSNAGAVVYGKYEEVTDTITLDSSSDLPEPHKAECLLHELLHFLSIRDQLDLSESTVRLLGVGLMSLIRENNLDFRRPK